MKLKYIVLFIGLPHHIPQSVTGRSGKSFGHACYDDKYKAHIIEISEEDWKQHGQDICAGLKRRTARSYLLAAIIPDENAPETLLAEAIDKLKADLQQSQEALSLANATVAELVSRISVLEKPALADMKGDGITGDHPVTRTEDDIKIRSPIEQTEQEPAVPVDVGKVISEMGYRDLREVAKAANKDGERIKLNPQPPQEKLRKDLLALPDIAELLKAAK